MLVIRLSRTGKKNAPSYRIVVAEKSCAVKGKNLEVLGHYNSIANPKQFFCHKEKVLMYLKNGAKLSNTVQNLLCDQGVLPKNQKIKKIYAKKTPVLTDSEEKKPQVDDNSVKEEPVKIPDDHSSKSEDQPSGSEKTEPIQEDKQ